MRRFGLYDTTRGLTLALAAGCAGLLLWLAAQVGTQTAGRFWAAMGIVAAAGLVVALAQVVGSWTSGLRLRLSPATLVLTVAPVLICVGWVLFASQPGTGPGEGTLRGWSDYLGILGIVHALGLWHGALAFGFGLVLGHALDAVPQPEPDVVPADEPVSAERRALVREEPHAPVA